MTDKEKKFIKEVNIDKAKSKNTKSIILIIISLLTYVEPLIMGNFDFGIIFEILTLLFIFIARGCMNQYDETNSKRFNILAMIPIGWIVIYDFIRILSHLSNTSISTGFVADEFIRFVFLDGFIIIDLIVLLAINKDLNKADNPEKYKESNDWFYESLDEKDDTNVNNKM